MIFIGTLMYIPVFYLWIVTAIIALIGLFFIFVTYYTLYLSYKNRKDPDAYTPSGVPGVGGICLIIAFLISSCKWLAFLGLIDYGLWWLPYLIIKEYVLSRKK